MKSIAIGGDHAGYDLKGILVDYLQKKGYSIKDFGTYSEESTDYADYVHPLSEAVEKGEYDLGIIICGSANGVSMTANKHQSVRAALCWTKEIASLARQHNNANIISIPARFTAMQQAIEMVDTFLETAFEGGRHQNRVDKIPIKS